MHDGWGTKYGGYTGRMYGNSLILIAFHVNLRQHNKYRPGGY